MITISVLHRHGTYEEFECAEFDTPLEQRILIIYDEKGRVSSIIPFDSVASIDFDYGEEEEEKEELINPMDEVNNRPRSFAPQSYTLDNYWGLKRSR